MLLSPPHAIKISPKHCFAFANTLKNKSFEQACPHSTGVNCMSLSMVLVKSVLFVDPLGPSGCKMGPAASSAPMVITQMIGVGTSSDARIANSTCLPKCSYVSRVL